MHEHVTKLWFATSSCDIYSKQKLTLRWWLQILLLCCYLDQKLLYAYFPDDERLRCVCVCVCVCVTDYYTSRVI
jgi:hypothetical protein